MDFHLFADAVGVAFLSSIAIYFHTEARNERSRNVQNETLLAKRKQRLDEEVTARTEANLIIDDLENQLSDIRRTCAKLARSKHETTDVPY